MNPIELGAKQAIVNCLKVKKGEKVVVITDLETQGLAAALIKEAEKIGAKVEKFVMEDFGERPEDGKNPLKFPKEIAAALSGAQVSIYIASSKNGERESFRLPLLKIPASPDSILRHAHMIAFSEIMMSMGMAADYSQIQKLCAKVYDVVHRSKEIRVTTPLGTDFVAKFDPKYKWIICDGTIKPGTFTNLPDGEVFGSPITADGKVVVDGCLGDHLSIKYGFIEKTPLSFDLKDGRCVKGSIECANAEMKKNFEDFVFNEIENADRVGEFGIGTNTHLTKIIGKLLQDEKFPGIHIAFGDPYPHQTGAEWKCPTHNDCVIQNTTIVVDGKMIMKGGKFTI